MDKGESGNGVEEIDNDLDGKESGYQDDNARLVNGWHALNLRYFAYFCCE